MEIRTADAGRGAGWLMDGFEYFKRSAGVWIGMTILLFIFSIVLSIIPLGGIVLQVISPALAGGLMLGCKTLDDGKPLEIGHLFAGFTNNAGALLGLGGLYIAALIVLGIVLLVLMIVGLGGTQLLAQIQSGGLEHFQQVASGVLLLILIGLGLYVPILMGLWFAPAHVVLGGCGVTDAVTRSFKGCLANIVPFLVYGVVGLVLSVIASIPLMLGWLVLFPMVTASVYIAYKEIFGQARAGEAVGP